jgi:hypothetical protein
MGSWLLPEVETRETRGRAHGPGPVFTAFRDALSSMGVGGGGQNPDRFSPRFDTQTGTYRCLPQVAHGPFGGPHCRYGLSGGHRSVGSGLRQ